MQHKTKHNFYTRIVLLAGVCCVGNAFGDVCKNGYGVVPNIASNTFVPVYKGTCEIGYKEYEFVSGNIYPIFQQDGCAAGQRLVGNGVCVDLTQGECKNDYSDITTAETTMAPLYHGVCDTGYTKIEMLSRLSFYLNAQGTHCGAGYHPTADGSCVAWPTDGCDAGQYSYASGLLSVRPLFDKTCESGYTPYHVLERVCFNGEVRTYADACSPLCSKLNMHTLRVANLAIPLYDTKTTPHALVTGNPENKCYINLLPGRQKGTINVRVDDEIWHAVD